MRGTTALINVTDRVCVKSVVQLLNAIPNALLVGMPILVAEFVTVAGGMKTAKNTFVVPKVALPIKFATLATQAFCQTGTTN